MEPETVWGERWRAMDAPIARQYMTTAVRSNSLVCLAADKSRMSDLLTLVRSVGPFLAALKTHVDVVEDWTDEGWKEVRAAADDVDLLLFEDRKFADIGGITQKQMHGMYGIASWADLVTATSFLDPTLWTGAWPRGPTSGEAVVCFCWPRCPAAATSRRRIFRRCRRSRARARWGHGLHRQRESPGRVARLARTCW